MLLTICALESVGNAEAVIVLEIVGTAPLAAFQTSTTIEEFAAFDVIDQPVIVPGQGNIKGAPCTPVEGNGIDTRIVFAVVAAGNDPTVIGKQFAIALFAGQFVPSLR